MHTILVLEDDMEMNQMICYSLKKEGFHIFSACSYQDGKTTIEHNTIELVILDRIYKPFTKRKRA